MVLGRSCLFWLSPTDDHPVGARPLQRSSDAMPLRLSAARAVQRSAISAILCMTFPRLGHGGAQNLQALSLRCMPLRHRLFLRSFRRNPSVFVHIHLLLLSPMLLCACMCCCCLLLLSSSFLSFVSPSLPFLPFSGGITITIMPFQKPTCITSTNTNTNTKQNKNKNKHILPSMR